MNKAISFDPMLDRAYLFLSNAYVDSAEKCSVVLKIARGHQAHSMKVWRENKGILVDSTVLHHGIRALLNVDNLLETVVQEINLQIERPPWHIVIEIVKVRVVLNVLVVGLPVKALGQNLRQSSFTGTYVAGNSDMFNVPFFQNGVVVCEA